MILKDGQVEYILSKNIIVMKKFDDDDETQQAYQDLKNIACRQIGTKSEEGEDKEIDVLITEL